MYFIILSVEASALLVSSVITIVILLRKQFKQWINTPLHILSISDVLFSIFTSTILLINYIEKTPYTNFNEENGTSFLNSSMTNDDFKTQKIELERFNAGSNNITNDNNLNIIQECNVINIIMKYGMLFFPFTNSFVSLLMFSIQCNLSVINLKNQCSKFLQFQEEIDKNKSDTNQSESCDMEQCDTPVINKAFKMQLDSISKFMKSERFQIVKQKFVQTFKYNDIKKGKKVTSILLVNQWIIPILIIGILYLAEYDNRNYIKDMENIQCFTESNFFFDECYNNITPINITQTITSNTYPTTLYKDYINNEDLIKSSDLNNTDVNAIIYKVQNIVNSALNETFTSSHNMTSYDTFELLNMTKYLKPNAQMKIINYNDTMKSKINSSQNTLTTEYKNPYSLRNLKNNISLQNHSILLKNATDNYNKELVLSNFLITNFSIGLPIKENNLNKIIINTTENLHFDKLQVDKDNQDVMNEAQSDISVTSDDQKYTEIFKYIHNNTINYNIQNLNKNNSQYEGKLKQNISEDIQYNPISDNQNVLSVINVVINKNNNISKIIQTYVINKCYISIKFLKLNLLVFIFVIYFLPILFSSILYQRGKLNCQILLEKLKAKHEMLLNNINFNFMNEIIYIDSKEATISNEDFEHVKRDFEESINSCISSKKIEIYHKDYNKKNDKQYKHNEQYDISFHRKKLYLNMINQVKNILKLFGIIKMSLLCGILLWTPIFLELLLKVFMLSNIPEWLMNITYLSATMFGILRNVFNLEMIKLQEINTSNTKTNIIHPVV